MPETTPKRRAMDQTDIATSQFALVARELIKLITSLRALGAQADFDLPRIAVIGNQSAGKSSLVEAISGISVPRSHGTCTRCPMECRLTNSEGPWRCQILLRREMDETGQRSPTKEEKFGPLLRDKSELEEMIRRAQLAVLNPGLSATFFETFDTRSLPFGSKPAESPKQLAFSSSVVCLDLAGPDLPDLSFIDLPGIISTVDKGEDKGNIDAVKAMVQEHIKGNTLILLTTTMRDDINNQGAAHLAQLEDPSGGRTIGVLTKPDLIQDGEEDGWLKILQGSSHQLTHGYFITKHPSPKELEEHVSHEDAREREEKFFETSPPWSYKLELRSRMGTPSLTRELSALLGALIRKSLPALREEADASLGVVKESLDRLPPPPSDNPATELLQMVNNLLVDVQALVNGTDGFERLLQRCRPAHQQLKFDILSTAPNFKPFKSETGNSNGFKAVIDQDDADFQESGTHVSKALYLDNIKSYIQRSLPFNVPFSVKVDLIKRSFENWEAHCLTCFDTIHRATVAELRSLAQQYFGGFSGTTLLADVRLLVDDLVEKHRLKTLELVKFQLELEDPPFTVNDHYFSACRDNYLAQYKAASKVAADPIVVRQVLASLASLGYNVTQGDLAKLQKEDKYDEEFIVMAETSAYFRVAYKRVIDNIPRVIDHAFLRAIVKELYPTLVTGLALAGDNAAEQAARYLAEDHQVRAERRHLTQKKGRLEEALKELRKFQL
ncbi:hypothetical protein PHLGIDRAFT_32230 [Phlebiopsis gigantea 11061_1 CR5-6]|uniref:GED domain-containing protein n=1 Tax=Phlebiopsis gigantea (strain 11061_1 CR5-6) TaxID=745531 RepID=A0A0C3S0B1_PHLG1|nr:hypothetical protein PHLGIDRAFT_32230 [Phlebiopsis gigantea 11061_1 CR5-6]